MESRRFWVPVDPDLLRTAASSLRDAAVLTPSFDAEGINYYDPTIYLHARSVEGTGTTLLCDRNVFTRWIALVRGETPTREHRVAAAVMAFALCAQIDIEPAMALHECAAEYGNALARDELLLFRVGLGVHPGYWLDIALGVDEALGEPEEVHFLHDDATSDLALPLKRWRRNYVMALKLAELELEGGSAKARMQSYLEWMYTEFMLGGPAIALGALYLAPNASRRRLLKGLRSADREKAIAGIRNAAWDLSLVSHWLLGVAGQTESNELTILASFDRAVHTLARTVAEVDGGGNPMTMCFCSLWGAAAGKHLAEMVEALYASRDSGQRRFNRPRDPDYVDHAIRTGELRIREWSATPDA